MNFSENLISVVVPCFNEEESLPSLVARLCALVPSLEQQIELILVDDGSVDSTWNLIESYSISITDVTVRGVQLSRNFGQQAALFAGLKQADGDYVLILDADLQDPPELLIPMLECANSGADVVYGQRTARAGESRFKRLTAWGFYKVLNYLSDVDIPLNAGDFRLVSRRALDAVLSVDERRPYSRGLFSWVGFKQVALPYDREPRYAGVTKWGALGMFAYAMDAITSFSVKPLRLASFFALFAIGVCGIVLFYALLSKLLQLDVPGWTSVVVAMSAFSAGQFLVLGVVGEYLARLVAQTNSRPLYFISRFSSEVEGLKEATSRSCKLAC